ncbi:MAG: glucose-6-phosphate isomerase [Candidatus Omnitrophica bacterium]|jgi:glucose-6-phosphate isomerase|nr:glucose-6-phosphate isomerase [Candidatus Omnitrophota bacterium]MDD5079781.1 glucose-6-phosphate isomerase [Candidatus Omnitrophota bacterium]
MKTIKFDFNNMFDFSVGKSHGVTAKDLRSAGAAAKKAHQHLSAVLADKASRVSLGLEWQNLPSQDKKLIRDIQRLGNNISAKYDNVISLGIGGSYLGLKAAQDALAPAYYNEFAGLRKGRPRIYLEGNNLDPQPLAALLRSLNPKKTFVIVISKSGETTETKAAFAVVEPWLKNGAGPNYGRQIFAITDPVSGALRKKVNAAHAKDSLSFNSLPLLKGVGGRYSELNMGLLHLAILGVDIAEVLSGAKSMSARCRAADPLRNPAYMYALLHTILYRNKNKPIGILMPFCESLKSTADWYCQLLAESTGKKYARLIKKGSDGREEWVMDRKRIVNLGRTPISTRGTNDLHSVQQNNIEGVNDKTVTFIRVENFRSDIKVPGKGDLLSGKAYSKLLGLAQEATEWAMVRNQRPNCTIILPEVTPFFWGQLLFFFEMATAFEGELLNINAFDQPGVEGYKNYMYYKLRKPGLSRDISSEIEKYPLVKRSRLII